MNFKYTEEEQQVFGMNSFQKKSKHINLKDFLGQQSQFNLNKSQDSQITEYEDSQIFWLENLKVKEILELIGMFKNEY